jgi:hypothetical protein
MQYLNMQLIKELSSVVNVISYSRVAIAKGHVVLLMHGLVKRDQHADAQHRKEKRAGHTSSLCLKNQLKRNMFHAAASPFAPRVPGDVDLSQVDLTPVNPYRYDLPNGQKMCFVRVSTYLHICSHIINAVQSYILRTCL